MKNKYVHFISDEHLLQCIGKLHKSYLKAKNAFTKKKFYTNKIDSLKLTFDAKFNDIDEETLIEAEVLRQIDKSINNSIGTFHEQILGGIKGFEIGNLSGFDIKADDDTLFAAIHYESIKENLVVGYFETLANYANLYKKAKIYWVDFFVEGNVTEKWQGKTGEFTYSHKNVYKISGSQFYYLLTDKEDALHSLNLALPVAIDDYLNSLK